MTWNYIKFDFESDESVSDELNGVRENLQKKGVDLDPWMVKVVFMRGILNIYNPQITDSIGEKHTWESSTMDQSHAILLYTDTPVDPKDKTPLGPGSWPGPKQCANIDEVIDFLNELEKSTPYLVMTTGVVGQYDLTWFAEGADEDTFDSATFTIFQSDSK